MDDIPLPTHRFGWTPPMPSEADLAASLARSEAEYAAGQFVAGDDVLRELDESIARMEAKHAGGTRRKAATRR